MATIFLRWPDPIKGSATADGDPEKYKDGWMDAASISFDSDRAIKQGAATATNREAAHPKISEIKITKAMDVASTLLFQESVTGKPKLVKIHLCSPGAKDGKMRAWATIELTNCIITQYVVLGVADGVPMEELSLAWTKINFVFKIMDETNSKEVKSLPFAYDLATNVLS